MLWLPALLVRALLRTFFGARDIVALAMRRAARRRGPIWGRLLYTVVLFVVILFTAAMASGSVDDLPHAGRYLFLAQAAIQIFVAFIFPPMIMAQAIAEERRRGTISLLLLTHKNPAHIVRGLLTSRLLLLFAIFLGGAPVASIAAQLGGVTWQDIGGLTLGSLALAVLGASVGAYFGAELPPRLAPYFACIVNVGLIWFFYYPALIIGLMVLALNGMHVPALVIAALTTIIASFVLAIVHRFLTREAGKALIRRSGDAAVVLAPPSGASRKAISRKKLQRLDAMKALEPGAALTPSRGLVLLVLAGAIALTLVALVIPRETEVLGALRAGAMGLLAFGGIVSILCVLGFAAFYPAIRIASFRGDPTTVILALTPFDGSLLLPGLERRLVALLSYPFAVAAIFLLPESVEHGSLAAYAESVLATACLVLGCLAISELVGIGERRPARAIGAIVTIGATALATLLFLPANLRMFHPLAVPVTLLTGSIQGPSAALSCYLLFPVALLLRAIAHRRLSKMWREPFESLGEAQYSFGM